ncbi:UNVERIFIED_CONTAM: hypothetical protein K2H54_005752 [Gekko kuhli]
MGDLMAGEKAAFTKARKKRVTALQSVGELLVTQAREDHREARREDRRDFQDFLKEMRAARQEDKDARAMMLTAMERSVHSTDKLTRAISLLVRAQAISARAPVVGRVPDWAVCLPLLDGSGTLVDR